MTLPLTISALGACTALGDATTAAAAFRAGLRRTEELRDGEYNDSVTNEPACIVGYPVSWCGEEFEGLGRQVRLASAALHDLHANMAQVAINTNSKVGMIVCLPDLNLDEPEQEGDNAMRSPEEHLFARLPMVPALSVSAHHRRAICRGRTGLCEALRQAAQWIESGNVAACLVGAVDSLVDPLRWSRLWAQGELKTADRPGGLIPGEAAVFFLLQAERSEARLNESVIHPCDEIRTDSKDSPLSGQAVFEAAMSALTLSGAMQASGGSIYPDHNGQAWRAQDWGSALVRFQARKALQGWRHIIAAEGFGDTGAASGALALALAARAFSRGYAYGQHAMITLAEENGERAALVMECAARRVDREGE